MWGEPRCGGIQTLELATKKHYTAFARNRRIVILLSSFFML